MKRKKAFITGCGGFIGSHLAEFLIDKGLEVYGTVHDFDGIKNIEHLKNKIKIIKCDITDKNKLDKIVKKIKPDYVFHLAAQSFVIPSWKDPEKTLKTNILGTLYLLDAIRRAGIDPIIIIACSSAEYGLTYENEIPINETHEFRPSSPYAVSKIGEDMLAYLYWQTYKMKIIRARFFNITGPRKTFDACSDFAKGIVEIEKGKKKELLVGNLRSIRDFTDVRDAVQAMWLLTEKGKFGDVYNICSGRKIRIEDILNRLIAISGNRIKIKNDKNKKRPLDDPIFVGDNSKIKNLGWEPKIPLEKTLEDMIDYWRKEIK